MFARTPSEVGAQTWPLDWGCKLGSWGFWRLGLLFPSCVEPFHVCLFGLSASSASAVQANAATLFRCDAPERFRGLHNVACFPSSKRGERIMTEFPIFWWNYPLRVFFFFFFSIRKKKRQFIMRILAAEDHHGGLHIHGTVLDVQEIQLNSKSQQKSRWTQSGERSQRDNVMEKSPTKDVRGRELSARLRNWFYSEETCALSTFDSTLSACWCLFETTLLLFPCDYTCVSQTERFHFPSPASNSVSQVGLACGRSANCWPGCHQSFQQS